ncbi:NAD(P)-binding domain-containing protein [Spirillospora albida]|uniref:NAD(P)-binding domain-containing protein n=1 Tax=Spirillospora albida TaxID=58123 RepID=UPI001FE14251|nr:NAD(P)-binding domain-containing protein [Spirillospora albida]
MLRGAGLADPQALCDRADGEVGSAGEKLEHLLALLAGQRLEELPNPGPEPDRRPHRPSLPGLDEFGGTVLHSADYRRPEGFAGMRVVIVGGGNSAVQIAIELAAVAGARVTPATRYPLRFMPQRILGRDAHLWLQRTGLDTASWARPLLAGGKGTPVMDTGTYRGRIAAGNPDRRPMFTRLDGDRVAWPDGTGERVDVVLLATGYRPGVDYLAALGALDAEGRPAHRGGVSTTHPGLGYVGLEWQRSFASATLRGVGADARHVLAHLLEGDRASGRGEAGSANRPDSRVSRSRTTR